MNMLSTAELMRPLEVHSLSSPPDSYAHYTQIVSIFKLTFVNSNTNFILQIQAHREIPPHANTQTLTNDGTPPRSPPNRNGPTPPPLDLRGYGSPPRLADADRQRPTPRPLRLRRRGSRLAPKVPSRISTRRPLLPPAEAHRNVRDRGAREPI